jgi:PAS domain S-box-containing protein
MLALVVGAAELRIAIDHALVPHGFEIRHVATAAEVDQLRRQEPCPLILLDWSLPDAAAACRAIVDRIDYCEAFVIAVSSTREPARLAAMLAAGARDVMAFPGDAARLVARALDLRRSAPNGVNPRLYRLIFEHNPLPICLLDDETLQFLAVSDGAVSQYGWSREEFLRMNLRDLRPLETARRLDDELALRGPSLVVNAPHRRKDGSSFVGQGMLQQLTVGTGQRVRFAMSRDVTEEVRVAEAHRRSLTAFRDLVERSPDGVFTHRIDLGLVYANPAFATFLGFASPGDLLNRSVCDLVHPDDRAVVLARMRQINETGQPTLPRAIRFIGRAGETRWAETRGILVIQGDERAITVIARDLTERRKAEEALRLSEQRFSSIFQASPAAIGIMRLSDGRILEVNDRFEQLTGFSRSEVVGKTSIDIALWDDPSPRESIYAAVAAVGRVRDADARLVCKDGQRINVLVSAVRVDMGGEPCMLALAVDISERKRLDEQLRHAGKMEAIGRLAGGIAHDFNNLLTAIRGYSELLLAQLPVGSSVRDAAQHIQRSALRAASVTGQLLAFTRRQAVQPRVLVIDETMRQMASLLRRIIGGDITLSLQLAAPRSRVRVDETHLEQVILNLAVNARDAMPDGGQITITTETRTDEAGRRWVLLVVSDTGTGMDDQVRTRMFEPFFTTKEVGRGTGLGLSIVYGIIEQSGGTITVESVPGRGTTFQIALPQVEAAADSVAEPAISTAPRGRGVILLVEDDEDVRDFVRFVLARAGYQVLEAEHGADALAVAGRRDDIQLLLSDVVMPHLNGHELAERVRRLRPSMKVLFMSGNPGTRGTNGPATVSFLQKPFSVEDLLQRVRATLEEPQPR